MTGALPRHTKQWKMAIQVIRNKWEMAIQSAG